MVTDVKKITQGRQAQRDEVKKSGTEASTLLEMQYMADSLEAIRAEIVGIAHLVGSIARSKQ